MFIHEPKTLELCLEFLVPTVHVPSVIDLLGESPRVAKKPVAPKEQRVALGVRGEMCEQDREARHYKFCARCEFTIFYDTVSQSNHDRRPT